jgi:hypothetical protein
MSNYYQDKLKNITFIVLQKKLPNNQYIINIQGTGFVIENQDRKKKIVTCAHLYETIPESDRQFLYCGVYRSEEKHIISYENYKINFEKSDIKRDIAIFSLAEGSIEYSFVENDLMTDDEIENVEICKDLIILGFPFPNDFLKMKLGITILASKCIVGSIKYSNKDEKIDFIQVDRIINPGNSGSPVFYEVSTGQIKILGIASGNFDKTQIVGNETVRIPVSIGMVRTANYIRELINK